NPTDGVTILNLNLNVDDASGTSGNQVDSEIVKGVEKVVSESDISDEEKEELKKFLFDNLDIFKMKLTIPGKAQGYPYRIYIEDGHLPIKRFPYRYSQKEKEII